MVPSTTFPLLLDLLAYTLGIAWDPRDSTRTAGDGPVVDAGPTPRRSAGPERQRTGLRADDSSPLCLERLTPTISPSTPLSRRGFVWPPDSLPPSPRRGRESRLPRRHVIRPDHHRFAVLPLNRNRLVTDLIAALVHREVAEYSFGPELQDFLAETI